MLQILILREMKESQSFQNARSIQLMTTNRKFSNHKELYGQNIHSHNLGNINIIYAIKSIMNKARWKSKNQECIMSAI